MAATVAVGNRLRQELAREQQALAQKHGMAHASSDQLDMMDGEGGELPMVKLGDASIAAPFTSKLPSIRSCVDIIRQGHCTLVSTVRPPLPFRYTPPPHTVTPPSPCRYRCSSSRS